MKSTITFARIYAYLKADCPKCEGKDTKCSLCKGTGKVELFPHFEKVATVNGRPFKGEISYCIQKEDGTEEETSQFPRSEELKIVAEIPKSKLHEFYIDGGWDELEAPTKKKKVSGETVKVADKYAVQELYKEAERFAAKGIIGVGKFVKSKSFREWLFVVVPTILDNGKFGWLVGYTTCKILQTHLMDVPLGQEVAPQAIPAKSYLNIEALTK